MNPMASPGLEAVETVDEAIDFAAELGIEVRQVADSVTVVDFGVRASGGFEAGLALTEVHHGGRVAADVHTNSVGGHAWPLVDVFSDRPDEAVSVVRRGEVPSSSIGAVSGPGVHGYDDPAAVVVVPCVDPVDEDDIDAIAGDIDVPRDQLYVLEVAPGSQAWCVDASVRALAAAVSAARPSDLTLESASASALLPPVTDPSRATDVGSAARTLTASVHLRVDDTVPESLPDGVQDIDDLGHPAERTIAGPAGLQTTGTPQYKTYFQSL